MSFLSDLGGFFNDVQHISEEFDAVKQDVVSNVKDTVLQIESQGSELASELQSNSESITQSAKDATQDIRTRLQ